MSIRRFLIVDDTSWVLSTLADLLRPIPDSKVTECSGRESAIANVRGTFYDVCFIDLMLRNFEDPNAVVYEGIPLIEEIRRISYKSVIVAYSAALKEYEELNSRLFEECQKAGADIVISRASLISTSQKMREDINSWIADRRRKTNGGRQLEFKDNLTTKAAIEDIGEWNLKEILEDVLPSMSKDIVSALDGGYSGAIVLQVHSSNSAGTILKNILKLSRQEYMLENEFRRKPTIGSLHERSSVSMGTHISKNIDGWRGIIFREIIGAIPLANYLNKTELSRIVQRTLNSVVQDLYVLPAKEAVVIDKNSKPEEEYKLSWKTGATLEKSLDNIINMSALISKSDRDSASIVKDYLLTVVDGRSSLITTGLFAVLHGDLHAQNIFVKENSAPIVIDFERSTSYPRLFDIAALHVDLLISRLQTGRGAEWDFKLVDTWEKWALGSFPFCLHDPDEDRRIKGALRIQYIRNALVKALRENLDDVSADEYGRAFLFQTARYLKFPTVSLPKKLLAIRLSKKILKTLKLV